MPLDPTTCEIRFEPSGRRIRVAAGSTLLEAARGAGLPVASACGADGLCARCGLQVLDGEATLTPEGDAERATKMANRIDPVLRLACQLRVRGDLVVTAPYW